MKRRIFYLLLILILPFCLIFTGCSSNENVYSSNYTANHSNKYRIIEVECVGASIYVDKQTRVMYLFVKVGYGAGLTVMLDENGKPLLYEGEL